jgi:predicted RNase H-like HicB family nuclease
MAKYVFPAIFTPEENGYTIIFPDVKNCFTEGDSLPEAMDNANDVLCMMLYNLERNGKEIPTASNVADVQRTIAGNEFVTLISCDTIEYRKFHDNRAVKKTLSIPSWLNEMAEKADINFSALLQSALKQQLNIQ